MQITLLNNNPYIFYTTTSIMQDDIISLSNLITDRKCYFIVVSHWYISELTAKKYRDICQKIKHRIIFLANSIEEYNNLRTYNLETQFINHNCFVDPNIYNIQNLERTYKAIYTARFNPFKRHYLASKIDNLACVCSGFYSEKEREHYYNIINKQKFTLLNNLDEAGNILRKIPHKLNIDYNSSCVGLCLSSIEGAMYASVEYLLCGLPIVSTKSLGGRDVFFDDYNSKIADDPISIRDAVEAFYATNIDRSKIRTDAISKQQQFLKSFKQLLLSIFMDHNIDIDIQSYWNSIYRNKMLCKYDNIYTFFNSIQ